MKGVKIETSGNRPGTTGSFKLEDVPRPRADVLPRICMKPRYHQRNGFSHTYLNYIKQLEQVRNRFAYSNNAILTLSIKYVIGQTFSLITSKRIQLETPGWNQIVEG